tara:strand:- start:204 stop:944 length:741 start_codon:yes stop_codon:yes gene_type:complete
MALEDEMAAAAAEAGLPTEPELPLGDGGMLAEGAPALEGGTEAPATGADIGVDLDALFSEIDQFAAPAQPQGQDFASMLGQAQGQAPAQEEAGEDLLLMSRIEKLEGALSNMRQRNQDQQKEMTRQSINNAIVDTVGQEVQKLGLDKSGKAASGLVRLVQNATLVSVAKAQAASGQQEVDESSLRTTAQNWTKILRAVADELATQKASTQRRAAKGATPSPFKSSKDIKEMDKDEFDNAVLAFLAS